MAFIWHSRRIVFPCCCHAIAMRLPCLFPYLRHVIAMRLLCCHAIGMRFQCLYSWQMLLPWSPSYCHGFSHTYIHTPQDTHIHTCAYTYLRTYNLRCGERPLQTMPTVRGERPTLQRASPAMQQGGVSPAMQQGGVEASLPCRDQVVYEDSGADIMPQNPSQLTRALCKCRR